jgi:hypothetical protein
MKTKITLEDTRSYATEENLIKAIEKFGLTSIRHIISRTPDGRWTAVFLVSEWVNKNGGYVGVASQHRFMSV